MHDSEKENTLQRNRKLMQIITRKQIHDSASGCPQYSTTNVVLALCRSVQERWLYRSYCSRIWWGGTTGFYTFCPIPAERRGHGPDAGDP